MGRTSEIYSNPAQKTIKWKNQKEETEGKGANKKVTIVRETGWYYYDKSANDGEGGEVKIGLDLAFLWLEVATSFTGYNKASKKGVYSNEVTDTRSQKMTVKMGDEVIAEGLYNNIKDKVKGLGGKFCAAVYAMVDLGNGNEIVRILMAGSARNPWFDISKDRKKLQTNFVVCYDSNVQKMESGGTYEEPMFKLIPASDSDQKEADLLFTEQVEPYIKYITVQKGNTKEDLVETPEHQDEYQDND